MQENTRTPFALILALWVAGLCAAAQFAKISMIFPELLALYPDSGAAAGFLVSLLSFIGMALGLFAGIVVARLVFASCCWRHFCLAPCCRRIRQRFLLFP